MGFMRCLFQFKETIKIQNKFIDIQRIVIIPKNAQGKKIFALFLKPHKSPITFHRCLPPIFFDFLLK